MRSARWWCEFTWCARRRGDLLVGRNDANQVGALAGLNTVYGRGGEDRTDSGADLRPSRLG